MAKKAKSYENELKQMIRERTKAECEAWLMPQIRATAMNMVMLDKVQTELMKSKSLTVMAVGSMGQMKSEANPLMPHYKELQRTLTLQFEALGLNYRTNPQRVKEPAATGVDEADPMVKFYAESRK